MAINISQAFHRTSPNPLDETMTLTKAQMKAVNDNIMPDKYFTICQDDGEFYMYDKSATASPETGKFSMPALDRGKEISKADFDALSDEEKNNGTAYFIPDANIVNNLMIVGNKFDKSNIYTSTERMIGGWMDKPLYQKTIHISDIGEETTLSVPHNIEGIGQIVGIEAMGRDNLNYYQINFSASSYTVCWADVTNIHLQTTKDKIADEIYVTLKYTKADDGEVSVGTLNDYSTNEVIVGTWINGKPIYQRTYDFGSDITIKNPTSFAATGGTWYNTGISSKNMEQIISAETASAHYPSFPTMLTHNVSSTGNIGINNANARGIYVRYLTIRYTKITD